MKDGSSEATEAALQQPLLIVFEISLPSLGTVVVKHSFDIVLTVLAGRLFTRQVSFETRRTNCRGCIMHHGNLTPCQPHSRRSQRFLGIELKLVEFVVGAAESNEFLAK
jgi:hypothetical protein